VQPLPLLALLFGGAPPPIAGGSVTTAPPGTVALMVIDPTGIGQLLCSGTVIAEGWVLPDGRLQRGHRPR